MSSWQKGDSLYANSELGAGIQLQMNCSRILRRDLGLSWEKSSEETSSSGSGKDLIAGELQSWKPRVWLNWTTYVSVTNLKGHTSGSQLGPGR